ncbi:MAG: SDR family oxidoreductase [Chloroflexi bacterium]|nr:SDR family oxidoreductase [Chloroflexota bacterium]MBP8057946.1 SDR family oxidoreductase [Chloroflexota bacterium]
MDDSLFNKVALVTGGASGIGQVTAYALAKAGARVVIADVNAAAGEETAQTIRQRGGEALFVDADVTDAAAVQALIQTIVVTYGRLDCAFNNAGVEGTPTRTADASEADFDFIMRVNVKGVWLCMKHEINQMIAQGGGAIVNTASVAGLVGAHSLPIYSASKHAVVGLTKSAAVEYAKKGIRVNAVCPTVIRTPMVERGLAALPKFMDVVKQAIPMRRIGEPEEVAAAVVWLCSDAARFVTGTTLTIDGGFTAQ